jgi:hypothetical protein
MLLSEQLEVCVSADTQAKNLEPAEKERLFSLLHQSQYTMKLQTENINQFVITNLMHICFIS